MHGDALKFLLRKTAIRHWSKTNSWLEADGSSFALTESGMQKVTDRLTKNDRGFSITVAQLLEALSVIKSASDGHDLEEFSFSVPESPAEPLPENNENPDQKQILSRAFTRSEEVRTWIVENAGGKCEACDSPAPFSTASGRPYLEVHHVVSLADGGPDSINNCVALCPNCHRALHHSHEKSTMRMRLRNTISRLRT